MTEVRLALTDADGEIPHPPLRWSPIGVGRMAPDRTTLGPRGRSGGCARLARASAWNHEESILSAKDPVRSGSSERPPTRRERREALRREQAGQRSAPGGERGRQPIWRSPIAWVTVAAVVVALIVIAVVNLRPGSTGGTPTAAPGSGSPTGGSPSVTLNAPAAEIPAGVPRDGRTLGASTAKVSLDVWEDFQCPACGNFSEQIEPTVIQRYVVPGKIRYTFHDFAFLGPESLDAASAARCAGQQDRFWDYHGYLYANQNGENQGWFSSDRLAAIATRVGVDRSTWDTCHAGGSERQAVNAETQSGVTAGVKGTPTMFLDGKLVPLSSFSSWDDFYAAIDAAVAAAGSTAPTASPASSGPAASSPSAAP